MVTFRAITQFTLTYSVKSMLTSRMACCRHIKYRILLEMHW